jgi:hypothetical protein
MIFLILNRLFGEPQQECEDLRCKTWQILGFHDPNLLDQISYQKEAILTLIIRATEAKRLGKKYAKKPHEDNNHYNYRTARNSYTEDVLVLRRIHPMFRDLPLHWSELPDFIQKWNSRVQLNFETKVSKQIMALRN